MSATLITRTWLPRCVHADGHRLRLSATSSSATSSHSGYAHGPQVVIDAGILEVLPEAIKSTKAQTRKEVCMLMDHDFDRVPRKLNTRTYANHRTEESQ